MLENLDDVDIIPTIISGSVDIYLGNNEDKE